MREALLERVRAQVSEYGAEELPSRVRAMVRREEPLLGDPQLDTVVEELLAEVRGLGPLDVLMNDPSVTDVLVNGPSSVWIDRSGTAERTSVQLTAAALENLIERIVGPLGLRADRRSPIVDARLPDGARVHAVMPPVAVDGPYLSIRRFGAAAIALDAFLPPEEADQLRAVVRDRRNVLISGGTGSGKTTLLNALAASIGHHERIVTIEDAAELRLPLPHVVRLEARPANADGIAAVSIRDLVRSALRLRPDRIIVGEVRGGEAFDLLQAMNTGHAGSMSTIHANTASAALRRLEFLVLQAGLELPFEAVRRQVAATIDVVIQVERLPDGRRRVKHVLEIDDPERLGAVTEGRITEMVVG